MRDSIICEQCNEVAKGYECPEDCLWKDTNHEHFYCSNCPNDIMMFGPAKESQFFGAIKDDEERT